METIKLNGSIVCYDSFDLDKKHELKQFLDTKNLEDFLSKIKQNIVLVLGGDGTMLSSIGENSDIGLAFLGINYGSKGFLLNNKNYINIDCINSFISRKYPLLDVKNNGRNIGVAFNDVNIYSPEGRLVDIDLSLGSNHKTKLIGDGVIISTPAGSTGHSKSYNGPMLPHISDKLIITPKGTVDASHSKVIDGKKTIYIKNSGRNNKIGLNIDGKQIYTGNDINLEINKSKKEVELLILENYIDVWDDKFLYEQGFENGNNN